MSDEEKQAKAKVETEAQAKAEAQTKLEDEAAKLGIKKSKVKIPAHSKKIKDQSAEARKHEELINKRLANRIAKAKAKPLSDQAARKRLITARLTHSADYPKLQVAQWKWELLQMSMRQWRPGKRMPKKGKTVYEDIMDGDE